MDITVHKIIVKEGHKFGDNDYVKGRIAGYKELLCDGEYNGFDKPTHAIDYHPGVGEVFYTKCSQEDFDRLCSLVKKHYPGLCEFD